VPTDLPDLLLKKMEALSYLGDDQGVLDVFTQFQKASDLPPDMEAFALHLAAAATARQGDETAARRYWKKALKLSPDLSLAEENLANLDAPAAERAAAWAFSVASWVPSSIARDLMQQVGIDADLDDEAFGRAMRRFLRKHPGVIPLIPILLERADPMTVGFALTVASFVEDEQVLASIRDFALGKRGPLMQRHMAARIAMRAGLLPGGTLRMWNGKEWTDMLLLDFEIHGEHEQRHSRAVERLLERGSEALHSGDGVLAEQLFRQALVQEPEAVDARNNLAAALTAQGRTREADEMIIELFAEHPDYFFARTNRANLYVREGKLDAATDLLAPLLQRNRLHFSELTALCQVQVELLLAQGKIDGARTWFELWEGAVPESPNLELWRGRVHPRLRLPWKHAG
jgi:Tfp pilus assembly protein PilF